MRLPWIAAMFERKSGRRRNLRTTTRLALGILLGLDIAAALWALKPWAASAEELGRQAATMRRQIRAKRQHIAHLQQVANKVEVARADGDRFMDDHILSKRTVSSTLLNELGAMSRKAGIRQKETTFSFEPVEDSEDLTQATVTSYYEGTYADLMHFLNELDRSRRFLIIDSLAAAPQQTGLMLNVTLKLNAFVREGGAAPAVETEPAAAGVGAAGEPSATPPVRPGVKPSTAMPAGRLARTPGMAPPAVGPIAPGTPVQPGAPAAAAAGGALPLRGRIPPVGAAAPPGVAPAAPGAAGSSAEAATPGAPGTAGAAAVGAVAAGLAAQPASVRSSAPGGVDR